MGQLLLFFCAISAAFLATLEVSRIKQLFFIGSYCTYVAPPPIVFDDSSWKNAVESFTVAITLTLVGYESAILPFHCLLIDR